MCNVYTAAPKYYVFGIWNIYSTITSVEKNEQLLVEEYDSLKDALNALESKVDSNVNIMWSVSKSDPREFKLNITKGNK